jgi:hypothetical protein
MVKIDFYQRNRTCSVVNWVYQGRPTAAVLRSEKTTAETRGLF